MSNGQVAFGENGKGLTTEEIERCVIASLPKGELKRVLLIPPDGTRAFSGASAIVSA